MNKNKELDKAFDLFNKRKFKDALGAMESLVANEETESHVKARLRQFVAIAEKELAEAVEEKPSLKLYSYHVNLKNYDKAEETLATLDLGEGDKLFLRAEMAIEQGKVEASIDFLKQAIAKDHHFEGYALNSASFAEHLTEDEFDFLRNDP